MSEAVPGLSVRGLGVRYGRHQALSGVDLDAPAGEVLALVGPNGSGKTSLLRALAGMARHDGTVRRAEGLVGYMPQETAARTALTVFEVTLLGRLRNLTLRVDRADLDATEAALSELGVAHLAQRPIGEISGGQRQLVFLAQVLAGDPRILLLDEPTSALDISHQLHVLGLLRDVTLRRGLTTVVVLHDLNAAARHADRIALLREGRLVAAGPPAVILTPTGLRETFGVEVAVLTAPDGRPVVVPMAQAFATFQ